ncbi:MAG: carboxyl transferase domain-containing protein, partial [Candidatus Coproplasma sp.]
CYNLPYVTFVNTLGISPSLATNNSLVLKELGEYVNVLDCIDTAKISIIYGKAIGLGYTVFAAKSMGYDFTYAFANAKVALFDSAQGAEIEFSGVKNVDKNKLVQKYSDENSDPINAAKGGYIDNIIEPAYVKQYLIASLQMLVK